MIVAVKRYSQGDPDRSITYRCSQFPDFKFEWKALYKVTYSDGQDLTFKCTRGRETLYLGKMPKESTVACVPKGPNPPEVFHHIVKIEKVS